MHVHIGFQEFLTNGLMLVLFGFLWRSVSARYADTAVGKAMAFIY